MIYIMMYGIMWCDNIGGNVECVQVLLDNKQPGTEIDYGLETNLQRKTPIEQVVCVCVCARTHVFTDWLAIVDSWNMSYICWLEIGVIVWLLTCDCWWGVSCRTGLHYRACAHD